MPKPIPGTPTPDGILALNPEGFREKDGVIFDLDSYARHYAPETTCNATEPVSQKDTPPVEAPQPHGVFGTTPVHVGWYEQKNPQGLPYPIMQYESLRTEQQVIMIPGSGSGSFVTSYLLSSFSQSSYSSFGSFYSSGGSGTYLSSAATLFSLAPSILFVGGYGLELI